MLESCLNGTADVRLVGRTRSTFIVQNKSLARRLTSRETSATSYPGSRAPVATKALQLLTGCGGGWKPAGRRSTGIDVIQHLLRQSEHRVSTGMSMGSQHGQAASMTAQDLCTSASVQVLASITPQMAEAETVRSLCHLHARQTPQQTTSAPLMYGSCSRVCSANGNPARATHLCLAARLCEGVPCHWPLLPPTGSSWCDSPAGSTALGSLCAAIAACATQTVMPPRPQ